MTSDSKYEELYMTRVNGNISDFNRAVSKMRFKSLQAFLQWADDNGVRDEVSGYIIKARSNPCGRKRTNPRAGAEHGAMRCSNCRQKLVHSHLDDEPKKCHNCQKHVFKIGDTIFCDDSNVGEVGHLHYCESCAKDMGLLRGPKAWGDTFNLRPANAYKHVRGNPRKEVDWKKGYLTEAEVNLLKNRMNRGEKVDLQPLYDAEEMNLTPDQVKKGFNWLWNLYKTPKGKERSRHPFGYREIRALESFKTITLIDFYNAGNAYRDFYVPFYAVNGKEGFFEYAVYGGELHILG